MARVYFKRAKGTSVKSKCDKKNCLRCGCPRWRSDVMYCWDCYKFEKFESR